MPLRLTLTTIILCYYLSGCDTSTKKEENIYDQGINNENVHQNYEQAEHQKFQPETKVYSNKEDQCQNNCAEVIIQYPYFNKSEEEKFNQIVENQIESVLEDFTMSNQSINGFEAKAEEFIQSYASFKKEFPDVSTPWTLGIDISVKHQHPSFITLSTTTNAYTGGAHPLSTVQYLNVSSDGEPIADLDYFISDKERLKEIAEKQFRSIRNIPDSQSFSDAGFSFENDQFYLPENFGFSEIGLVIYYNSYEVGPYALGPTEVIIQYSELKDIYKFQPQL